MKSDKLRLILAMALFGTIGVFVHFTSLPSAVIALARSGIGAVALLLICICKGHKLDSAALRKNFKFLIFSGGFLGFNWILLFEAYRYTTVATATVCYYLAPILLVAVSPFILKEKLSLSRVICIIVALIGMVFVSGVYKGLPGAGEGLGLLFGIASAVLYAAIVLLNKKMTDIDPTDKTVYQLFISAVVLLPYCAVTGQFSGLTVGGIDILMVLILCLVHTALCYFLYFGAIARLPAQSVAIWSYLDPIVALLCSTLILREPMSLLAAIGAALILGATCITEFSKK